MFLPALVVVVLRESRGGILIMQQLCDSESEVVKWKMDALWPLSGSVPESTSYACWVIKITSSEFGSSNTSRFFSSFPSNLNEPS